MVMLLQKASLTSTADRIQIRDRIQVLKGEYQGQCGELVGIDGEEDGLVKLDGPHCFIKILDLMHLTKLDA